MEVEENEKLASKKGGSSKKKRKKMSTGDISSSDSSDEDYRHEVRSRQDHEVDAKSEAGAGPDIRDTEADSKPQQRYGHGGEGTLCDVCFMDEGEYGGSSFIKCRGCLLLVHSDCYFADGDNMPIDDRGLFDCDACRALKDQKHFGGKVKKNSTSTPSPDPLSKYIEAKSDGRNYPMPTGNNEGVDIFCQLCARRDVSGGMKATDAGKWVHLACMMTSKEAYIDSKGKVVGINKVLSRTKQEMDEFERETGNKATCEACLRSNAVLLHCTEDKCQSHLHPLCAEIANRVRVVTAVDNGDIIEFKCATHGYGGLHAHRCVICGLVNRWDNMLGCDGCGRWYHLFCLNPQLKEVPDGDWFCTDCHEIGRRMLSK